MARSTFRLGEELPPPSPSESAPGSVVSLRLPASGRTAGWGMSGSAASSDAYDFEDKVAQFSDFAEKRLKKLMHQLVQRYEQDLLGDGYPSCFSFSPTEGANAGAGTRQTSRGGDSFGAASPNRQPEGGSGFGQLRSNLSFYSQVMDTVMEDSSGSESSSPMDQDPTGTSSADSPYSPFEELTKKRTTSGASVVNSHAQSPLKVESQSNEYHDSSRYDSGGDLSDMSSNARASGLLPAWVAQSLFKGPSWKEKKTVYARMQSFFAAPSSSRKKRTLGMIVSSSNNAEKDSRRRMECFCAIFCFLNALFVCWELQFFVTGESLPLYTSIISAFFTLGFSMELLQRWKLVHYRLHALIWGSVDSFWNVVDVVVLACLWAEHIWRFLDPTGLPDWLAWDVSLLRTFRFAELTSSICSRMKTLREIRLLFRVVGIALRSWVWILVFTSVVCYICSIFLARGTYPLCHPSEGHVLEEHTKLCEHFATLEQTFFTCYKATFGGLLWGDLVEAIQVAPFGYQVLFVAFVAFGVIILANLAAGVLIEVHANGKRHDIECMIAEEEKQTSLFIEAMHEIFREMDANQSGVVSKEELQLALQDSKMNALLRCYKLEMHDAHLLFDLLDTDNSGTIDVEEFIAGCLKMKGTAQAVDIVRLQIQMNEVHSHVGRWADHQAKEPPKSNVRHISSASYAKVDSRGNAVVKKASYASYASRGGKLANGAAASAGAKIAASSIPSPATLGRGQPRSGSSSPKRGNNKAGPWRGTSVMSNKSNMLSNMVPTWQGCRIAKAEDRAMLLSELRVLKDHIKLHFSEWIDEKTRKERLKQRAINMYQVNYNWICPLTIPEGVTMYGLNKQAPPPQGALLTQSPLSKGSAPRAIAEVLAAEADGGVKLKVLRGRFDTLGDISCEGEGYGVPDSVKAPSAMSYKELVGSSAATPSWYCCHWWGEPIIDFIACIEEHGKLRKCGKKAAYWICAFANSQHDLGYELSPDPETSSFRRAMLAAQGVLLVLDAEATPFHRIWCDYELYHTVLDPKKALDIVTMSKTSDGGKRQPQLLADLPDESAFKKTQREARFPISALAKGVSAKLEDGDATVSTDKTKILMLMKKELQTSRPGYPADDENQMLKLANRELNAFFAWCAWPQALKNGVVRNFGIGADGGGSGIDLAEVTSQEDGRKQLRISLAHFPEVTDAALSDIVSGLPPALNELALSFEGCINITDRALQHLARGLKPTSALKILRLDFLGCKQITDLGLKALALGLPPNLVRLRLDFAMCKSIGYVGLASLAQHLPAGLKEFSCTLKGTLVDQNFDSVDALKRCVKDHAGTSLVRNDQRTDAVISSGSLSVRSLFGT